MILFPLSNEEKESLKRFNQENSTIFALKKLFLNACIKEPASNESIKKITEAFHDLEVIQPDIQTDRNEENVT